VSIHTYRLPTLWRRVDKPVCQTTQLSRKEEEKEREGTEERGKTREREKPVPCQLRGRLCGARRAEHVGEKEEKRRIKGGCEKGKLCDVLTGILGPRAVMGHRSN